jgi:hypothetical protein
MRISATLPLACPPTLPRLPPQLGKLAGRETVDDFPQLPVRSDRRAYGILVLRANVNGLRTTVELDREEPAAVPRTRVPGAGTVGTAAAPKSLDQRPAHQPHGTQRPELLAQLPATTLDLLALGCHVCNYYN